MYPFDHVCIGDVEFILRRRCGQENNARGVSWKAFDMNGLRVTISESDCTLLPSQCTRHGVWVHGPVYFREKYVDGECSRQELSNSEFVNDVREGRVSGSFRDGTATWNWNIDSMCVCDGPEEWNLRVMTPGGAWL